MLKAREAPALFCRGERSTIFCLAIKKRTFSLNRRINCTRVDFTCPRAKILGYVAFLLEPKAPPRKSTTNRKSFSFSGNSPNKSLDSPDPSSVLVRRGKAVEFSQFSSCRKKGTDFEFCTGAPVLSSQGTLLDAFGGLDSDLF